MQLIWIPKVGINEIKINQPLPSSMKVEKLEPSCEGAEWEVFQVINHPLRISVTDDLVISIECWGDFCYESKCLLGLSIECVNDLIKKDLVHVRTSPYTNEKEYKCEALNITFWVDKDIVESVTVY